MRSYLGLSLSLCLMFTVACSSSDGGGGGVGGGGGSGGGGGQAPSEGVQAKGITLGCSNNITIDVSILTGELQVDSGPITASQEFVATLSGTESFPEVFLDAAQSVVPGGVRVAQLVDSKTIVQVRSGATEVNGDGGIDGVTLVPDLATLEPGATSFCDFSQGTCSTTTATLCTLDAECPAGETCTGFIGDGVNNKPCDQADDNADGSNPACLPALPDGPVCQDPVILVAVPTSEDCAAGGECDQLDKAVQCMLNQFCVTGDLEIALEAKEQTYMAEASGSVLFGWADQGLTGPTLDAATGLYTLPQTSLGEPLEQGLQILAGALGVKVGCVMAVDSAGLGGVAVCVGGANEGDPCESPADIGNDICFGGANDGTACAGDADCPDGECANADCGVGAACEPTDLASLTPDSALI